MESITANDSDPRENHSAGFVPPPAKLMRRCGAILIDILVLSLVGFVLGRSQSDFWYLVGPGGRFVGLFMMMLYFGLLDSRLGSGQTLGKRICRIAVRDADNQPIAVGRATLRAAVVVLPFIFNGWQLPLLRSPVAQWLEGVIIFGIGLALVYSMLFNRAAGQGLHDLLCQTYVVDLSGAPIHAFPRSSPTPVLVSGLIIAIATLAGGALSLGAGSGRQSSDLANVMQLQRTLQDDERFFSAMVNDITKLGTAGKRSRSLQIRMWYKGTPSQEASAALVSDVARIAMTNTRNINDYDSMKVWVDSRFDLGIASGYSAHGENEPIEVWKQKLGEARP